MDSYYRNRLSQQIDSLSYPASLPAAVKRLLIVKLAEIYQHRSDVRDELALRRARLDREGRAVKASELTESQRAVAQAYIDATRAVDEAKKRLDAIGLENAWQYGEEELTVSFKMDAASRREANRRVDEELANLEERTKAAIAEFKKLVIDLANAQIAALRAKIPEDLVKRLDTIAPKVALPPADFDV